MVKCLRVYLHQAASLPDCQLCAMLWVLLKLSGGDGTMSHPGSVKRGDHIESTCCWRHMGRIRHRVFDWGKFLTLTAEEDEHEAVVL